MSTEQPALSIEDLEAFFNSITLPKQLRMDKSILIADLPKFVKGHLSVLKAQGLEIGGFYLHLLEAREALLKNPEGTIE